MIATKQTLAKSPFTASRICGIDRVMERNICVSTMELSGKSSNDMGGRMIELTEFGKDSRTECWALEGGDDPMVVMMRVMEKRWFSTSRLDNSTMGMR